ncbi:tRNA-specific adenosine deaminase 1 [Hondaea fermentalgiana]|uniref:tRNA-specific adenosine deaminase 1 n=1 Tax=Hondaea fermentalgiana TaxID=2315210 RepID=A0A2R5G3K5_9STRA|nr:tRNA-specific adenosine deaminase 1 [Hondaea fermentalgiana]|eukprot:GBG25590.1 tRNA-specific adenosine deaminase 1 [Hondaea fermentalgiana]
MESRAREHETDNGARTREADVATRNLEADVAAKALEAYASLASRWQTARATEWTVLAALVAHEPGEDLRVVSMATGSKCLGPRKMSPQGLVLDDCHAEVLARRGLCWLILQEVQARRKGGSSAVKEEDALLVAIGGGESDQRWRFRPDVALYLFVSELPCGDCSVLADKFSGAKLVADRDLRESEQAVGQLRAKSSRSNLHPEDRSLSMSCSDKIARWRALVGGRGFLWQICNESHETDHYYAVALPTLTDLRKPYAEQEQAGEQNPNPEPQTFPACFEPSYFAARKMDAVLQHQQQQQHGMTSWGQEHTLGLEEDEEEIDLNGMFAVDDDLDSTPALLFEAQMQQDAFDSMIMPSLQEDEHMHMNHHHHIEDGSDHWHSEDDADQAVPGGSVATAPSTPLSDGSSSSDYFTAHNAAEHVESYKKIAADLAPAPTQIHHREVHAHCLHPRAHPSTADVAHDANAERRSSRDGRKRKVVKPYGKVLSTIKSNRAKQAEVKECASIPKKEHRVKGVVYVIAGEAKRWDGRQWRRLCIVHDCHSAARGSGDLCIAHSKGEMQKVMIDNEVVEVVALGEEAAAQATAIAPVPSVIAAMRSAQPVNASTSMHSRKRKADHSLVSSSSSQQKSMRVSDSHQTYQQRSLRYDPSYTSVSQHAYQRVL